MHELHYVLCKRSLEYLKASEDSLNKGLYDVSGVLAQMSAELSIKATILFLGYSFPETHEIRKLLSILSSLTLRDEIQNFVKSRRGELILLENARTRGQYLSYGLDGEDAEVCLKIAKEIINLMKKIWGNKWCSD
ncbi:HEPN domain-containing protein [Saccharolobus islandicus]|uniref:HEPN domain protein n=1 Tax=Saccharolobus islandicus (strain M.16.27) TaxID=427318 RepID=C3N457_SACI3|nr:HEPN domain-containing protein [Sulfolobus islandicus]ACP54789.1 HEPN domain protein [Sulfolobus islandicus M.16.27]